MPNRVVDNTWPVIRNVMKGHTFLYRATGGRIGHTIPGVGPHLLLDHVGAKSGKRRTSPLLYTKDGDDLVIIASKGGNPKHPAWYHNLRANPDTEVQVGSEKRKVHARVAEDDPERKRLWNKAVAQYGGYAGYQKRTNRKIPVVVLERRR